MQIEDTFGRNTVGQSQTFCRTAPIAPRQGPAQGANPAGATRDGLAMSDLGRAMASASRGLEDANAVRPDKVAKFRHIVDGDLSLSDKVVDKILKRLADA